MNFKNRRAVVTGATRGIGRAMALQLAAAGAEVVATGTRADGVAPEGCSYYQVDFADVDSTETFVGELERMAPDILVNNAGINRIGPFADLPQDDFALVQRVNVMAPFRLCQAVVPKMKARGWGRIVNIASVWSKIGKELRAPYSTSKFALVGMSSALAAEVTQFGVLVNCVSPGPIETEMTRTVLSNDMIDDLLKLVPAGRLGQPDEVARLVLWLASDENTFVAGQNIAIDGGMTRV